MSTVIRQREPHELKIIPNGEPIIFSEGKIGAIVHYPVLVDEGKGYIEKTFEKFVRSPGTRIIAIRDNKIYLQKEARVETGGFDWRLPGGKVVDSFAEYKNYMGKTIPDEIILAAALKELHEEAKLTSTSLSLFSKKVCGATVEWDLYYIVARDTSDFAPEHEHNEGEQVDDSAWFTFDEVRTKCEGGEIGEGRTAAALIEFISSPR